MKHGGIRPNSGRKTSASPFGEATFQARLPLSVKEQVMKFIEDFKSAVEKRIPKPDSDIFFPADDPPKLKLPFFEIKVAAGTTGYASPAENWKQKKIDLNELMVINKPTTFLHQVGNNYDSMVDEGIMPKSIIVVDRSREHKSGDIVLAYVNGEKMVKFYRKFDDHIELHSSNKEKNYPPITFTEEDDLQIQGVVRWSCNEH